MTTTGTKQSDSFELTTTERTGERHVAADVSAKQQEIQGRIIVAKKFPRNEDEAFAALMKAAARPAFAEDAGYSFPRGDTKVEGPSVGLAREGARVWGNISFGLDILRDDGDTRQVRGWAWDMQTNAYNSAEDDFKILVQRKVKGSNPPRTEWIRADERELRELTNRRGAILVRNCLLQLLPKDLIQEAFAKCKATLADKAAKDPDGTRKAMISDFAELNITPSMLEAKLGHPLTQCTPAELTELRRIYKSVADGNSTWAEYVKADVVETVPAGQSDADMERIKRELAQKAPAEPSAKAAKPATKPAEKPAPEPPPVEAEQDTKDGYPAQWLSDVLDAEDFLRGSEAGKKMLRAIREGFKLQGDQYPMLAEHQAEYLETVQRTAKRLSTTK